ncbi:uncharacterized protein PFL1_05874 [Pseudozyma flocculosa PF-1]|uniref:Uncharacterized protein n=2 Tax=Pseudozyma flocculosa TaxID=84751 RepID=A0A5C3F1X6_9BASI|nr:uncharacterized protein PFL1_05874 [Pseudozyma flocculosa PF-1]EPQ26552.1 hypothetical protein PFL1_05874 [Pseudozyma flocculosa PF-1]SPO38458.1 uncharacterized protein PSFLO_03936 [Pseudozyma flocculosa]
MKTLALSRYLALALALGSYSASALPSAADAHGQQVLGGLYERSADILLEAREPGQATTDASGDPAYKFPPVKPDLPLDKLPNARPHKGKRRFVSKIVEAEIERITAKIRDPALKRIFTNAYPNTLDTTVGWTDLQLDQNDHAKAFPRSFIITGDINAAWLRDSTNQLFTYLPLLETPPAPYKRGDEEWNKLYRLALGLLYQQAQQVLTHPYANSFGPPKSATIVHEKNQAVNGSNPDADWVLPPPPGQKGHYLPAPPASYSKVKGNDGIYVWEIKYEVDSLAAHLRLPSLLAETSGRKDFVDNKTWQRAVRMAIDTLRSQQRGSVEEHEAWEKANSTTMLPPHLTSRDSEWAQRFGSFQGGVYRFQRLDRSASETKADKGWGEPGKRTGLVKSGFRPSDDSTVLPFLIPSNAQLAVALEKLAPLLDGVEAMQDVASNARDFAQEIRAAIDEWAVLPRKAVDGVIDAGNVYAFEVDGYGSSYFMDDANVPSLLSLPYLGYVDKDDETYQRTRKAVLDKRTNKWFFGDKDFSGIGGPHVGWGYAWPMSRIMQILTTSDADEQRDALSLLRNTTAGTGLLHESINVSNATDFTRPWFAWVNGLFGEAVRHVEQTNPDLLGMDF